MLFSWFKRRRRARLLAAPFPESWAEALRRDMWLYPLLSDAERRSLHGIVAVLMAEKNWEGCGGLELRDEIKVVIAAWAALLLLNLKHDYYPQTLSILVYPSGFQAMEPNIGGWGFVPSEARLGEAWHRGPVILAWDEALDDSRRRGQGNLIIHEFAHQLDMLNRGAEGTPPLESTAQYESWTEVMSIEYERLLRAAERGRPTLLDQYGAEDEAEFFAVVSECFFEMPQLLQRHHPKLYGILKEFYRQDPATRPA